jgi:hypothetical protein
MIKFEIEQEPEYKSTPLNYIGASTEQDVDDSRFTDTNSVFFSLVGNDITGDGTKGNPYKSIAMAVSECTATKIYAVSVDNTLFHITEPVEVNTYCQGIFALSGAVITIKCNEDEIPDGFITDLSALSRNMFAEYNNIFYVLSGTSDIYTFDGAAWTLQYTTPGNVTCMKATTKGMYVGTADGQVYLFTNPTTYTLVYNNTDVEIRDAAEYNGYLYIACWDSVNTDNVLAQSSDGYNFFALETNLNDASFADQQVRSLEVFADKTTEFEYLVLALDNDLLYSANPTEFEILNTFTYNGGLKKLVTWKGYLFLIISDYALIKIEDIGNFSYTRLFRANVADMCVNEHLYFTSEGNLYRYTLQDTESQLIKSGIGSTLGTYNDKLYVDDKVVNSYIFGINSDFMLESVDVQSAAIDYTIYTYSGNISLVKGSYNGLVRGLNNSCSEITLENCNINYCYSGIRAFSKTNVTECLFTDISDTAISALSGTELNINHVTIFNALTGIYNASTNADIRNSIIYFCAEHGVYSEMLIYTQVCCIARAALYNSVNLYGYEANPLFISENGDYRIKTLEPYRDLERGYSLESICKDNADDGKDIGCYLFERSITTEQDNIIIEPVGQPKQIHEELYRPFFNNQEAISGGKVLTSLPERKRIDLTFADNTYVPDLENYLIILRNKAYSGIGVITEQAAQNRYAKFVLSEQGKRFKVLKDISADWKLAELTGYQLEIGKLKARILFNTEQEIYISIDSPIQEGSHSYKVDKIKVILGQESIKAERLLRRHDLKAGFTLTLEETDV